MYCEVTTRRFPPKKAPYPIGEQVRKEAQEGEGVEASLRADHHDPSADVTLGLRVLRFALS